MNTKEKILAMKIKSSLVTVYRCADSKLVFSLTESLGKTSIETHKEVSVLLTKQGILKKAKELALESRLTDEMLREKLEDEGIKTHVGLIWSSPDIYGIIFEKDKQFISYREMSLFLFKDDV